MLKYLFMFHLVFSGVSLEPKISYSESKYKSVAASTTDSGGGVTPTNGELICIHRFIASGADPEAYVSLVWDYQGAGEKIFASTKGDVDIRFDCADTINQVTGDGSKMLKVIITNDDTNATPVIGGMYEVITL